MGRALITGGGLYHNNGAQAMTFVTVSEVKKRFPNLSICHLSHQDVLCSAEDKAQYAFEIRDLFSRRLVCYLSGWPFRAYALLKGIDHNEVAEAESLLRESELMIDVSGFAFGTRWGMSKSLLLPLLVRAAKRYGVRVYLMPQSFGPFDFPGLKGKLVGWYSARSFASADAIFAREQDGYEGLSGRYGLKNVWRSHDLVLQNRGIDLGSIYVHPKAPKTLPNLGKSSVAVLPNKKTFEHGNPDQLLALYDAIIQRLLDQGHTVYLMHHAPQDARFCAMIKALYPDEASVQLIEDDFTSVDFENILPSFKFLVASRFHCIVHAYKHGVPCVVPGWAIKYDELLSLFSQQAYAFNVCGQIDQQQILCALDRMNQDYTLESETILRGLKAVQVDNVYDVLGSPAKKEDN